MPRYIDSSMVVDENGNHHTWWCVVVVLLNPLLFGVSTKLSILKMHQACRFSFIIPNVGTYIWLHSEHKKYSESRRVFQPSSSSQYQTMKNKQHQWCQIIKTQLTPPPLQKKSLNKTVKTIAPLMNLHYWHDSRLAALFVVPWIVKNDFQYSVLAFYYYAIVCRLFQGVKESVLHTQTGEPCSVRLAEKRPKNCMRNTPFLKALELNARSIVIW